MWCESDACLADKLGPGRPECLGRPPTCQPKVWVATQTRPWTTQAVPHVRPSSLDARSAPKPSRPAHLGQPTIHPIPLLKLFSRYSSSRHFKLTLLHRPL